MSYRRPDSDAVFDACCQLSKQDIPEVEGVITVVLEIARAVWPERADDLVTLAVERVAGLEAPLPEDSTATQDFVLALVAALELRLGLVLPQEGQAAVLAAVERLLAAGGASVGSAPSLAVPAAAGLPQTGLSDLETSLRGRLQLRRDEVARTLAEAATAPEPDLAALRGRLETLLGATEATMGLWLPFVVDQWAYRWFNVGAFVGATQDGVGAFRLFNNPPRGPDERTTPFCAWVHKKLVPASRVEVQLADFQRAVQNNNVRLAMRAWPMLKDTDGTPTDFNNFFLNVGLPPYHGRCRTVARPA